MVFDCLRYFTLKTIILKRKMTVRFTHEKRVGKVQHMGQVQFKICFCMTSELRMVFTF